MINIVVGNVYSKIEGGLPSVVVDKLYDTLAFTQDGYIFSDAYKSGYWDGKKHLFYKKSQRFLTGLISYVREILDNYNIEYTIEDDVDRVVPKPNMDLSMIDIAGPGKGGDLWKHQKMAVALAKKKGRGVFQVSTGGGKTLIVSGIIAALNVRPFCFFVLSKDLMYQAQEELERTLLDNNYGRKIKVGVVGDGKCDIRDINVVMIQSAVQALGEEYTPMDSDEESQYVNTSEVKDNKEKIVELLNNTKGWYFDECQHLSAPTAQSVSKNTPNAYYRYGGSATPYRDDGADILIEAVTGRKFISVTASYLIKQGVLMKPDIHIIPVKMQTKNLFDEDRAKAPTSGNYNSVYKNFIVENAYRNNLIKELTDEFVSQGMSVLILVKQIKHGEILQNLLPYSEFLQGETNTDIRKDVIDALRNKDLLCGIATSLADEGLNIKSLNVIILAGGGKSSTKAFQRVGRVLRISEGKKDAIAIDFYDDAPYLRKHSRRRIKLYNSEEEFNIIKHSDD